MPPTATEVNARLHKAVNEEGKVLNMDAVNEMVAWLEKINMTMEVLEDTRIGRRMNLMRKNIQDKELAKRIKNLLKKWRKNMEKLKEKKGLTNDTSNSITAQPGNLQHLKRNIDIKQVGIKRKLPSAENSPNPRSSSPRVQSPSMMRQPRQPSPLINSDSPKSTSSPKLITKRGNQNASSPKIGKNSRNTPSPLVNNTDQRSKVDGQIKLSVVNKNKQTESLTPCQSSTNGVAKKETLTKDVEKPELFNCLSKDNDTRLQEDRISSLDSGYHGTMSDENSPSLSPNDKLFLPINNNSESKNEINDVVPTHFDPIEPEDLEIRRKEVTSDPTLPNTEADGINGVFGNDRYYNWTEGIDLDDYSLLPYVILD